MPQCVTSLAHQNLHQHAHMLHCRSNTYHELARLIGSAPAQQQHTVSKASSCMYRSGTMQRSVQVPGNLPQQPPLKTAQQTHNTTQLQAHRSGYIDLSLTRELTRLAVSNVLVGNCYCEHNGTILLSFYFHHDYFATGRNAQPYCSQLALTLAQLGSFLLSSYTIPILRYLQRV